MKSPTKKFTPDEEKTHFIVLNSIKKSLFELITNDLDIIDFLKTEILKSRASNSLHKIFNIFGLKLTNLSQECERFADLLINSTDSEFKNNCKNIEFSNTLMISAIEKYKEIEPNNEFFNAILERYEKVFYDISNVNIGLILKTVGEKKRKRGYEVDDYIAYGYYGLKRAIEIYEIKSGNKFSTYACYWIDAAIKRNVDNTSSLVRLPVSAKNIEQSFVSFDEPSNEDDKTPLFDKIKDPRAECFQKEEIISKAKNIVLDYIETLNNCSERYYIKYYFGYNETGEVKSKKEIMKHMGLTEYQYFELRTRSIKNIKNVLQTNQVLMEAYNTEFDGECNND